MKVNVVSIAALAALALSACNNRTEPVIATAPASGPSAITVGPAMTGPLLGPDGRCTGPAPGTAAAIEPGISECELVRLKGRAPTDVLVGESGKGHREVQVLYSEPGGRELYFFVDNRLDRVLR
jgi:hypothetical protein